MPDRRMPLRTAVAGLLTVAGTAAAAAPAVVADIAPSHAIVARVMAGVGTPSLLLPPGASPHGYAMRPSEAEALQEADIVFWVGEALTPWLPEPLAALASDATVVEFIDDAPLDLLAGRAGGGFADHAGEDDPGHGTDAAQGESHVVEHGHEAEHAAEVAEQTDDHAQHAAHADEHAEHDHTHDGADSHVWLDPVNAGIMAATVAETLAAADPTNAEAYRDNAEDFEAEMAALVDELDGLLAPVRDRPFVVFHDAYQYFEARFDVPATGAIALGDAERPSAARVQEIRDRVRDDAVACVFAEPQFAPALIGTVIEGTPARSAMLDPLGATLEPGPELYPQLIRDLADGFATCLAGES